LILFQLKVLPTVQSSTNSNPDFARDKETADLRKTTMQQLHE
jgi:hypothetical protein